MSEELLVHLRAAVAAALKARPGDDEQDMVSRLMFVTGFVGAHREGGELAAELEKLWQPEE